MTPTTIQPDLPATAVGTALGHLDPLRDRSVDPGTILERIPSCARELRTDIVASGTPDLVRTCDLVTLPYPTRFGLWRAAMSPAPYLAITNRMLVIRWSDADDRTRTLLWEPSDVALGRNTPYFAALADRTPEPISRRMVDVHGDVTTHLRRLGIDPAEVDYLAFDHLHTQDLRRWLGTTGAAPDLGADTVVAPVFPNAKLLVQRRELESIGHLHPQQRPWYQPETYTQLRTDAVIVLDGDLLVGPGVALVATPGHTTGNQSLVLNTSTGIWTTSENAIAAECLVPEHSRLPGITRWARRWGQDIVVNANTIEAIADQYNSLVLEKTLADPSVDDERFPQFFPSSELTRRWTNPGTAPTFVHRAITHEQKVAPA